MILSLDPGRNSGCAILDQGYIRVIEFKYLSPSHKAFFSNGKKCKYGKALDALVKSLEGQVTDMICERPVVYKDGAHKSFGKDGLYKSNDPNTLFPLYGESLYIYGLLSSHDTQQIRLHEYTPSIWKGRLRKEVHHHRLKNVIQPFVKKGEIELPVSMKGDGLDALGILLYWLTQQQITDMSASTLRAALEATKDSYG